MKLLPFLLMFLVGLVTAACEEHGLPPVAGGGHEAQNASTAGCTDQDGDGFFADCTPSDCNDEDDSETDGCYACLTPNEGCDCDEDGAVAECGHVSSVVDGYVSCVVGTRECMSGKWGACSTDSIETRELPSGSSFQGISQYPTPCAGNPCDPYCHDFPDEDPETEDGAIVNDDGVTLRESLPVSNSGQSCGGNNQEAERTPLGMVLMVDKSGSMNGSPWNAVTTALRDFLGSSGTDGMEAGLDFFPSGGDGCGSGNYSGANMTVGMGLLPPNRNSLITAINNTGTGGGTPMRDAINGALFEAVAWENAAADRKGIVVLVTDGLPEGCTNCDGKGKGKSKEQQAACRVQEVADLAERFYYNQGIETFVIGVEHSNTSNLQYLDVIARSGSGGARDAFIVGQNAGDIEDALNAIRDHSLPCEYEVPASAGVVDPASTIVNFDPSSGPARTIQRVSTPGACGTSDGFYYDSGSHSILLCPKTCDEAKRDLNAKISIEYQCVDSCSSGSERGSPGPFDLFVMMDRSGSMGNADSATSVTKWQSASSALRNFAYSEESEGMGMGLGYFPPPSRCSRCDDDISYPICDDWTNGVSCSPTPAGHLDGRYVYRSGWSSTCDEDRFVDFSSGSVPIGDLPGANKSQAKAIHYSLTGMIPEGGTPAKPALEDAIKHVKTFQSSNPDHKVSVVLVSDGEPNGCSSTPTSVANVASAARTTDGIDTYVLGVGTSLTSLHQIAQAGSGRNAFLVDSGDPAAFIDAMRAIRTLSMNCSFEVPEPAEGELDYESPRLIITTGDPALPYGLVKVDNEAACGNVAAWYYDDNANPQQIFLCPRSCDIARNNGGEPRVDILYECIQDLEAGDAIFEYDTVGMDCPNGSVTRWSDWSWIAETPADSYVEFFVQTGERDGSGTITNLSAEVPLQFTRPSLDGDALCVARPNQRCYGEDTQKGGPLALRPGDVDVDTTLVRTGADRTLNYLRIRAAMHPDSSLSAAPILREWDLQLSCRTVY